MYINLLIKNMPMLFLRYIDDIFIKWKGNYHDLANFLHGINKQDPTFKSDFAISKETVSFLETKVHIDIDRNI